MVRVLLADDPTFVVPRVIPELSSKRIITTELVYGIPMDQVVQLDQQTKTEVSCPVYTCPDCLFKWILLQVAYQMLKLCLREVFEFQFMQTDPNWSNFFYNIETKKVCKTFVEKSDEFVMGRAVWCIGGTGKSLGS